MAVDEKKAIEHLQCIYQKFLKDKNKDFNVSFTIKVYEKVNNNKKYYADIYIRNLGGWRASLKKANIPIQFSTYTEISEKEILNHVKRVYSLYKKDLKIQARSKVSFRRKDYSKYNLLIQDGLPISFIVRRFGTWSKVLTQLNIPVKYTRKLSDEEILEHLKLVYEVYLKKEKYKDVFSKKMYDKYNITKSKHISSKLLERRFGSWKSAKIKLSID